MKYYGFRFQPPDSARSTSSLTLQNVVIGFGIFAVIFGAMLSGGANGRGNLNLYTGGMVTLVCFFALMAKFSDDYPRTSRWLIIIPSLLVDLLVLFAYLSADELAPAVLAALLLTFSYFLIVSLTAARQLMNISDDSE